GPELLISLANQPFPAELVVVGDPQQLQTAAQRIGLTLQLEAVDLTVDPQRHRPGYLKLLSSPLATPTVAPQHPSIDNAAGLIDALTSATKICQQGQADALVTGPIDKSVINRAGIAFSGHTELLAQLTNTEQVVMLLASESLKVALLTTHIPLKEVATAVTRVKLIRTLEIIHHDLQRLYHLPNPRIAVCGLNPHAGEGGYLGDEETDIIEPVLNQLRDKGMALLGPLPADTAFTPEALARCDLVLAMYHDQGLPPLKQNADHDAINVTLGLPIIRTSVDHGTAYDLAGTGEASSASFVRAIHSAINFTNPG
ncbi:MAG: 4-hydroxythreonine-4-phosphate dehydrogenase PdxA, partial [Immundisolibacteraceae bacterium]|nr:4-hydroxythreonine-4-phosphate dehydrogenase PdxA [Immundisolibacteraceae bacterium]